MKLKKVALGVLCAAVLIGHSKQAQARSLPVAFAWASASALSVTGIVLSAFVFNLSKFACDNIVGKDFISFPRELALIKKEIISGKLKLDEKKKNELINLVEKINSKEFDKLEPDNRKEILKRIEFLLGEKVIERLENSISDFSLAIGTCIEGKNDPSRFLTGPMALYTLGLYGKGFGIMSAAPSGVLFGISIYKIINNLIRN